jgi:glycosyltransferase involved in cell wall biosynthesis
VRKRTAPGLTVDFVVCTRNRTEELKRFCLSVARQSLPPSQLIVIDASDEFTDLPQGLADRLRRRGVDLVHVPSEPGLTLQRNRALQWVKSDWVAYFDDDVALDEDYNRIFLEECERLSSLGQVGGAQGTITNTAVGRLSRRWVDRIFLLTSNTQTLSKFQASGNMMWPSKPEERRSIVDALNGCCQAYLRNVLRQISFNETLPGYSYKEDVEFSRRARAFGDLWQVRDARLLHFQKESRGRPDPRKMARLTIYNDHFLYRMDSSWREEVVLPALVWASLGSVFISYVSSLTRLDYRPLLGSLEGLLAATRLHLGKNVE